MESDAEIWAAVLVPATDNVPETVAHYRDVLGFAVDDALSGPDWAMPWADRCQLFQLLNPSAAATAAGQEVLICVPGVDAIYDRHKAKGAKIISELENKPWGLREYTVEDPNGYHLRFESHIETQYLPWKAKQDAAGGA